MHRLDIEDGLELQKILGQEGGRQGQSSLEQKKSYGHTMVAT